MIIQSIVTTQATKLLSGLANNSDSIIPMTVKDTISNCAIVATYKNKGGKDDARERAIEEFGTGAVWLFGIPTVKKLMDLTVYPLLKLKPELDLKLFKNKDNLENVVRSAVSDFEKHPDNKLLENMADTLKNLDSKNAVLSKFTNKQLYKGLFISKFLISTVLSAFALTKIIQYKQKTTQKRIENEISENFKSQKSARASVNKSVKNSNVYEIFKGKQNNPSFTGGLDLFMYNSIANTSILDGVITTTRLKEARKGERKEVALKEAFQIFFIYAIAKPTQLLFEKIGRKFKLPIELDPAVLFSVNAKEEIHGALNYIKSEGLENLKDAELVNKIYEIAKNDIKNPLLNVLDKNGTIKIVKKEGVNTLDYLKEIKPDDVKSAISNIKALDKNIDSNLKGIKGYKVFSVLSNIAIGALAMGVLQPLVNIGMRKLLNNGDNRNPAIVEQEKQLQFKACAL